jgi:hypothetical protein
VSGASSALADVVEEGGSWVGLQDSWPLEDRHVIGSSIVAFKLVLPCRTDLRSIPHPVMDPVRSIPSLYWKLTPNLIVPSLVLLATVVVVFSFLCCDRGNVFKTLCRSAENKQKYT